MSYDSPDFRVQMMHGPIFGSFASIIVTGGSTETATSVGTMDRVEFFRNIKVLDFKVLPKTGITDAGANASNTRTVLLRVGTDIVATAVLLGTDDAGLMIEGGVASGTLAEVTSNEELNLALRIVSGGTTETYTVNSVEAYILYEHRFA